MKLKRSDIEVINLIADRAAKLAVEHEVCYDEREAKRTFLMDLMAVHEHGCPLKLTELLNAENFDFAHDVFGINHHLNRKSYQLEDCFLPRYAA